MTILIKEDIGCDNCGSRCWSYSCCFNVDEWEDLPENDEDFEE